MRGISQEDPGKIVLGMVVFLVFLWGVMWASSPPRELPPYQLEPGVVYYPGTQRICNLVGENSIFKNPGADCFGITELPQEKQVAIRAKVEEIEAGNRRPEPLKRVIIWVIAWIDQAIPEVKTRQSPLLQE